MTGAIFGTWQVGFLAVYATPSRIADASVTSTDTVLGTGRWPPAVRPRQKGARVILHIMLRCNLIGYTVERALAMARIGHWRFPKRPPRTSWSRVTAVAARGMRYEDI